MIRDCQRRRDGNDEANKKNAFSRRHRGDSGAINGIQLSVTACHRSVYSVCRAHAKTRLLDRSDRSPCCEIDKVTHPIRPRVSLMGGNDAMKIVVSCYLLAACVMLTSLAQERGTAQTKNGETLYNGIQLPAEWPPHLTQFSTA